MVVYGIAIQRGAAGAEVVEDYIQGAFLRCTYLRREMALGGDGIDLRSLEPSNTIE